MLILARRKNETIVIDENIRVTVLEVRGNQIKIGIDAPKEVNIRRAELKKRNGNAII